MEPDAKEPNELPVTDDSDANEKEPGDPPRKKKKPKLSKGDKKAKKLLDKLD